MSDKKPTHCHSSCTHQDFSSVLDEHHKLSKTKSVAGGSMDSQLTSAPGTSELSVIGKISGTNPTVSNLLIQHSRYKNKCWQIVHSLQNKSKPFEHIQNGTIIFINPKTLELSWKNKHQNQNLPANRNATASPPNYPLAQASAALQSPSMVNQTMAGNLTSPNRNYQIHNLAKTLPSPYAKRYIKITENAKVDSAALVPARNDAKAHLHSLGKITGRNSTISSLLIEHPDYKNKCWHIIHSQLNRDKAYNKLQSGTSVYINPKSLELTWERSTVDTNRLSAIPTTKGDSGLSSIDTSLSQQLESAVKSYMGKSYTELDCYELVVQGLKKLGIRYSGKNGLQEQLIKKAIENGLPMNNYLTGEGLIQSSGTCVFSKTIPNPDYQAVSVRGILDEMHPILNRGLILSFSTPTRGHMGIISRNNESWTFINSGTMDNPLKQRPISKRVGEELLLSEINNWLRLSAKNKEPLSITIGKISEKVLTAKNLFHPPASKTTENDKA